MFIVTLLHIPSLYKYFQYVLIPYTSLVRRRPMNFVRMPHAALSGHALPTFSVAMMIPAMFMDKVGMQASEPTPVQLIHLRLPRSGNTHKLTALRPAAPYNVSATLPPLRPERFSGFRGLHRYEILPVFSKELVWEGLPAAAVIRQQCSPQFCPVLQRPWVSYLLLPLAHL